MKIEKLENLRDEMKDITNQILLLIHKRMELASRIGEIKKEFNLDIVDDRVEQEIKNLIMQKPNLNGFDTEFAGRIINLLISESVKIQNKEKNNIKIENTESIGNKPIQNDTGFSNGGVSYQKIKTHMDVFNAAKSLEAKGHKIIHMEVGEPDFYPPLKVKDELTRIYDEFRFHYTESAGISELRNKISDNLKNKAINTADEFLSKNVVCTVGGRFAIFSAFLALLKPGDEIIIIEPVWPAYKDCADFMGVKTKIIKTDMDNQWDPDISNIEKCINVNTKIICLNYPNNPTGKILSERKMQSIVNLAEKYNIIILSDEVYSNFSYCKFTSILDFPIKNAILIGSFSKTFSMTGFRVGFAYSTNIDIVNKLIKVQSLALTSVPEPMQYCALAAISCDPMPYANTMKKRLDFLCSKLKKMPFEFVYPDGAMYVYAKIKDCVRVDDLKLTEKLLDKGVAVAPGRGFGNDYKQYIRISACIDEAKLNLGLDLISSVVNSL